MSDEQPPTPPIPPTPLSTTTTSSNENLVNVTSTTTTIVRSSSSSTPTTTNSTVPTGTGMSHTGSIAVPVIVGAVAGGIFLVLVLFFLLFFVRNRRRKTHSPPLPRLTDYGLARQDSCLQQGQQHHQQQQQESSAVYHGLQEDQPPAHTTTTVSTTGSPDSKPPSPTPLGRKGSEEQSVYEDPDAKGLVMLGGGGGGEGHVYVNTISRDESSVGTYVVPDSGPTSPVQGVFEPLYIPMDVGCLKGSLDRVGEGAMEDVYTSPDQPPTPCLPRGHGYVNVPESEERHQDGEEEDEEQIMIAGGDYQNLCPMDSHYGNVGPGFCPAIKVSRSASLASMATPEEVAETLQRETAPSEKVPTLPGKVRLFPQPVSKPVPSPRRSSPTSSPNKAKAGGRRPTVPVLPKPGTRQAPQAEDGLYENILDATQNCFVTPSSETQHKKKKKQHCKLSNGSSSNGAVLSPKKGCVDVYLGGAFDSQLMQKLAERRTNADS